MNSLCTRCSKGEQQEFHLCPSQQPFPAGSPSEGVTPSPCSSSSTFSSSAGDFTPQGVFSSFPAALEFPWRRHRQNPFSFPKTKPQSPALGLPLIAAPQLPLYQSLQSAGEGTDVFTIKINSALVEETPSRLSHCQHLHGRDSQFSWHKKLRFFPQLKCKPWKKDPKKLCCL